MLTRMTLHQPEQVARAFVEAWEDRDPDAIAALFVADADFVNVTGLWWHDRAVSAQNTDRVPGAETMVADAESLTPRDYLGKRSSASTEA